ncbi:hypothetical protein ES708_32791 [subsurface metagenome]
MVGLSLVVLTLLFSVAGCQGEQGPIGPQGDQGIQGATGAVGQQGPRGYAGEDGEDGISITWMGTATSAPKSWRVLNYAYYNPAKGASYIWDGNSWEIWARDGHDGATGATGPRGYTGAPGADGADGAPGVSGYEFIIGPPQNFSAGGWAGQSCPEGKVVLGGGVFGVATKISCPAFPNSEWGHYNYGPNEYGWVAQSAEAGTGYICVICADATD